MVDIGFASLAVLTLFKFVQLEFVFLVAELLFLAIRGLASSLTSFIGIADSAG